MIPEHILGWVQYLSYSKLSAYCMKGLIDKLQAWSIMIDDHFLQHPPIVRKLVIPNLSSSDTFYQSVSILVRLDFQKKCTNCNQEGHSDEKCNQICSLCSPSCGQLPKLCPKSTEARKIRKSNI